MSRGKNRVSAMLKGDARLENESYEDYKIRRRAEKLLLKRYLKGELQPNQPSGTKTEVQTSWKWNYGYR